MAFRIQKLSQKQQQVYERRQQVANYRLRGIRDQRRVARELGVSIGTINADFQALNQQYIQNATQDITEAKGHDLARIDHLIDAIWGAAVSGDLSAIDRIRGLLADRGRILGLDAPKKSEITGAHGGPIEVDQNVTYSLEERQQRILAIVEQARTRLDPLALPERSDLDSSAGSTNGRVAH